MESGTFVKHSNNTIKVKEDSDTIILYISCKVIAPTTNIMHMHVQNNFTAKLLLPFGVLCSSNSFMPNNC